MKHPINPNPTPIRNDHQPCKPRRTMNHTDRLPAVHRPGSHDADALPRLFMGWRVWPDGRRERA